MTYNSADDLIKLQQHDGSGNVLATTTVDYPSVAGSSTDYGLPDYKIDPNGDTTNFGYDDNGYLSSVTTPPGHQTSWTRDNSLDAITARVDAEGSDTNYTLDGWLRLTGIDYTNSAYNDTYTYDYNGNLTGFVDN